MRRTSLIVILLLATLTFGGYIGSLNYRADSQLIAHGKTGGANNGWENANEITIDWEVSQNVDGTWTYHYVFTLVVGQPEIKDILFETGTAFSSIYNTSYKIDDVVVNDVTYNIGSYQPSTDIKNQFYFMPDETYGVRFSMDSGNRGDKFDITFDSIHAPTWGDFYANCGFLAGGENAAYNKGFVANDIDPLDPIANGTVGNHILVPTPEPTTIALLGLGLIGIRKRRRASL